VDVDKQGSDVSDWIYPVLLWDYVDVNLNEVERFGDSDEEQMEE